MKTKDMMVFDWDKAARLIAERKPQSAMAGLRGDWKNTGGMIYEDGKLITDKYTYLASSWAIPELDMAEETVACFRFASQTPMWHAHTKWPKSAVEIYREAIGK